MLPRATVRTTMKTSRFFLSLAMTSFASLFLAIPAHADISVGSDGSDGTLVVSSSLIIDLSAATTATWDTPSPVPGKGVYDPLQWAVVFKYDSIYVAPGMTVAFTNHATRAPVVWLVRRGVRIDGVVSLSGSNGSPSGVPATPGPGGFRGGKSYTDLSGGGGAGMGPGGGQFGNAIAGGGGGYGSNGFATGPAPGGSAYGSPQIVPLIGGSGGGGSSINSSTYGGGGGAGGGALLVACGRTLTLQGYIVADGGLGSFGGGGSGGAIRMVADQLAGPGTLYAQGGNSDYGGKGGVGRIRLETNGTSFSGGSIPVYSLHLPVGPTPTIWPQTASPRVAISSVAGNAVPADPNGNLFGGDIQISSATSVPVTISAANVPANATMILRAVLVSGGLAVTVNATLASGDQNASTWTATLPAVANNGYTLLQARVTLP